MMHFTLVERKEFPRREQALANDRFVFTAMICERGQCPYRADDQRAIFVGTPPQFANKEVKLISEFECLSLNAYGLISGSQIIIWRYPVSDDGEVEHSHDDYWYATYLYK